MLFIWFFFFKQKTAYEMRISDWSSDVCSSDLRVIEHQSQPPQRRAHCRLGQSDLFTGAAHAAFAQQCLKDDKQVEVDVAKIHFASLFNCVRSNLGKILDGEP